MAGRAHPGGCGQLAAQLRLLDPGPHFENHGSQEPFRLLLYQRRGFLTTWVGEGIYEPDGSSKDF